MSQFAWANPTNGLREQEDSLNAAVSRIQTELKDPRSQDLHAVVLYHQTPRLLVERTKAYSISPKRKTRLMDRIRLLFSRREETPMEYRNDL